MTRQDKNQITGNLRNHPRAASRRLGLWRMLNQIHNECSATFAAMRQADDVIDRTTRTTNGHEFAGYSLKSEVNAKYYIPLDVAAPRALDAIERAAEIHAEIAVA
jgi:hypothetical protein